MQRRWQYQPNTITTIASRAICYSHYRTPITATANTSTNLSHQCSASNHNFCSDRDAIDRGTAVTGADCKSTANISADHCQSCIRSNSSGECDGGTDTSANSVSDDRSDTDEFAYYNAHAVSDAHTVRIARTVGITSGGSK
jgi:hypothetical protein